MPAGISLLMQLNPRLWLSSPVSMIMAGELFLSGYAGEWNVHGPPAIGEGSLFFGLPAAPGNRPCL